MSFYGPMFSAVSESVSGVSTEGASNPADESVALFRTASSTLDLAPTAAPQLLPTASTLALAGAAPQEQPGPERDHDDEQCPMVSDEDVDPQTRRLYL